MNHDGIPARVPTTETPARGPRPVPFDVSGAASGGAAQSTCEAAQVGRTALAWDLLRQLQGYRNRPACECAGAHNVDEVTVDWLERAASPTEWAWLAQNFDCRRDGWPTVSLLEALLRTRSAGDLDMTVPNGLDRA